MGCGPTKDYFQMGHGKTPFPITHLEITPSILLDTCQLVLLKGSSNTKNRS